MKVAIIGGTGKLGLGFVTRLLNTAHDVCIGSRDSDKAVRAATPFNPRVIGFSNGEAATWCDVAIVTIPYAAHQEILAPLRDAFRGKVVIDATVPLMLKGESIRVETGSGQSAAEEAQGLLSESYVFGAFQTISHRILRKVDGVEDVLVAGNTERKAAVMQLIRDMNLRPVDAGPLQVGSLLECMTALLLSINRQNKVKESGITITGI